MLVAVLQLFLVAFGLIYFVALAVAGLRMLARSRRSVAEARQAGLAPLGQPAHRGPSRRAQHRSAATGRPSPLRQLFRRAGNRLTVPMVTDSRVAVTDPDSYRLYFI